MITHSNSFKAWGSKKVGRRIIAVHTGKKGGRYYEFCGCTAAQRKAGKFCQHCSENK